jgi:hypothetical protein
VPSVPRQERRAAIVAAGGLRTLGWLLGRVHTLDGAPERAGGAWHHLADGEPRAEADALRGLVEEAAFTHPDFVMANVVAPGDGRMVLVDWSGAGQAGAGQAPRACVAFS